MSTPTKQRKRVKQRAYNAGGAQEVSTPQYILDWVSDRLGGDYFDPCPREPTHDGLSINWRKNNFVNPPFGSIKKWLQKCYREITLGSADTVLVLVPFTPHHNYWDECVFGCATAVHIVTNPVTFVGYTNRCSDAMCFIEYKRAFDVLFEPALFWLQIPGWDEKHYKPKTKKRRQYRSSHGRLPFQ